MVGMEGLWKMFGTTRALPVDLRRSFPSTISQPPRYCSWSSHLVGYPVPGLVSTLFHHMYSVPRRSVQRFLHARLHVWQPMHLSRWDTIETCARTFMSFASCPSRLTSRRPPALTGAPGRPCLLLPPRRSLQLVHDRVAVTVGGWR